MRRYVCWCMDNNPRPGRKREACNGTRPGRSISRKGANPTVAVLYRTLQIPNRSSRMSQFPNVACFNAVKACGVGFRFDAG
jgi:hypothetical protein